MRIFLIILLASMPAVADDASKAAKINELLTVMKANVLQDQIYSEVSRQIETVAETLAQRAGVPAPEHGSATAELKDKMTAEMKKDLNWDVLKPGLVKAYSDAYSEPQIDELIAFFRSPIGQLYLTKSPVIAAETRNVAETHIKDMQASVQVLAKEWLDAHQAGGRPAPAAPKPSAPPK